MRHIKNYKEQIKSKKNCTSFQFLLGFFSFLIRLKHYHFDSFIYFKFFTVQFSSVFLLFSERCSTTTRGVHPTSFQCQLIIFNLGTLDLSLQQETKKKGQHDCNEKEKTPLYLMAGKTLMSFLRAGLSKYCRLGRHLTSSF